MRRSCSMRSDRAEKAEDGAGAAHPLSLGGGLSWPDEEPAAAALGRLGRGMRRPRLYLASPEFRDFKETIRDWQRPDQLTECFVYPVKS
jgi:hypothetical protein